MFYSMYHSSLLARTTRSLGIGASALLPVAAFASGPDLGYVDSAVSEVGELVVQLVPVVIAIGLLLFIWGLVQFIMASGDDEARAVGKRKIIWGIVALFVIVSVWGLVGLLNDLTGVEQGTEFEAPATGIIN